MNNGSSTSVVRGRDPRIRDYGVVVFAVLIALLGALMMTITSSAQMKGAAMLWVPAALQLMAGVWLGPVRGMIAGGIGAYAAGILAYGGWGLVDIIMNPIAGGVANSFLPGLLFQLFKIDPCFGLSKQNMHKAFFMSASLLIVVLFVGTLPVYTGIGKLAYLLAIVILLFGLPLVFRGASVAIAPLFVASLICVFCCALSALIGSYGVHLGGSAWKAALLGTGMGWFLGDTVSCFLGLYMLAYYTEKARYVGLTR